MSEKENNQFLLVRCKKCRFTLIGVVKGGVILNCHGDVKYEFCSSTPEVDEVEGKQNTAITCFDAKTRSTAILYLKDDAEDLPQWLETIIQTVVIHSIIHPSTN